MNSRIIVKNLPKKISEEKLKAHFSKIGVVTDTKLKHTKDGKFRQFAFVGYKNENDAQKAIEYFNNTYIDASKIIVESCRSLNGQNRVKAWSKYSKDAQVKAVAITENEKKGIENAKKEKKSTGSKESKNAKKLERLIGDLKSDEQFQEFLAANKAINSKENIWRNDVSFDVKTQDEAEEKSKENGKNPNKNKKKGEAVQTERNKNKSDSQEPDFENGRLFVRNLCYLCKEEDLEKLFEPYGPLVECSMPLDSFSKNPKGFAYVTCMFPEKAAQAFKALDGSIFQGRMLHIIPAKSKKELSEEDELKLSFKQKKEKELKKKSQSSHNWNTLFINQDSVANLIVKKYNIDKSELYDVNPMRGRNKASVAVKLAVGETQIVNDLRKFLVRNGVKLDAFANGSTERSKTVILIKNLPNETAESELKEFMRKNGVDPDDKASGVKRLVMPDYAIAVLIEFNERQEARDAFKKLAYRKFKSKPFYLEWAPIDVFDGGDNQIDEEENNADIEKVFSDAQKIEDNDSNKATSATSDYNAKTSKDDKVSNANKRKANVYKTTKILIRNIPFEAKAKEVEELFRVFGELKYVRLPKKVDGTHRGFGFVDFVTLTDAERAFEALCHSTHLFGRRLVLEWAQPEQTQDVEILRQKESQISGPSSKRLKKSKLLDDLGKEDNFDPSNMETNINY